MNTTQYVLSTKKNFWILLKTNEDIALLKPNIRNKKFETKNQIWKSVSLERILKVLILFIIVKEEKYSMRKQDNSSSQKQFFVIFFVATWWCRISTFNNIKIHNLSYWFTIVMFNSKSISFSSKLNAGWKLNRVFGIKKLHQSFKA